MNVQKLSGSDISEATLLDKTIFAFLGSTSEFAHSRGVTESLKKRLILILGVLHKCIEEEAFDTTKYKWITEGKEEEWVSFVTIRNQMNKPSFATGRAKKFPFSFAAICTIGLDILTLNPDAAEPHYNSPRIDRFKELTKPIYGEGSNSNRLTVFKQIIEKMRSYSHQSIPNWTVSIEEKTSHIVIKTGRTSHFHSAKDTSDYRPSLDGKYTVFRKAIHSSKSKVFYIRETLVLRERPFGMIFEWHTVMGKSAAKGIFKGMAAFPKSSLWLIGSDDSSDFFRMRCAALPLRDMLECSVDQFVFGELLSTTPDPDNSIPASRTIAVKAINKEEYMKSDNYLNEMSAFISKDEITQFLTPDEIKSIL